MEQPPGNKLVLDPNADTVIILRHANAEFAVWDEEAEFPRPPFVLPEEDDEESMSEDQETSVNVQTAYTGNPTWLEGHEAGIPALSEQMEAQARVSVEVTNEESGSDASESSEGREEYLFYVSSRHLALASTYFHNNLSNKWDQHPRDHEGRLMITERRWSVEGFMRLMCIMHGRTRAVARELELEQLAEMAAMVDYYSCDEVVEPYSQGWIDHQRKKIKPFERTYNRDLVLWMCIAWVFGQKEEFERTTLVAIKHCSSEMQSLELPIPELIIGKNTLKHFLYDSSEKFDQRASSIAVKLSSTVSSLRFPNCWTTFLTAPKAAPLNAHPPSSDSSRKQCTFAACEAQRYDLLT